MSALLLIKIAITGFLIIITFLLLSWAELFTQIGRYRNYWEKNNAKPAAEGEILYVALGDSTAQGIGATSPQKGYVGLIAKKLEESKKQPVRTVNLSKSGAKAKDVLETQLPALKALDPTDKTVVTIEIGANDMDSFDAAIFEKEMDEIMRSLPGQTLMSDIPYFGGGFYKNREPDVVEANRILYRLAEKNGLKLIPLHDRIKRNSGFRTLAADFFHPSDASYRENWAPVFLERLP